MHVEAAQTRRFEHRLGQDEAVGGDHRGIEAERGEFLRFLGAKPFGRENGDAQLFGRVLHRRCERLVAAAGGARRLAIDRGHFVRR